MPNFLPAHLIWLPDVVSPGGLLCDLLTTSWPSFSHSPISVNGYVAVNSQTRKHTKPVKLQSKQDYTHPKKPIYTLTHNDRVAMRHQKSWRVGTGWTLAPRCFKSVCYCCCCRTGAAGNRWINVSTSPVSLQDLPWSSVSLLFCFCRCFKASSPKHLLTNNCATYCHLAANDGGRYPRPTKLPSKCNRFNTSQPVKALYED